jgi:hypothetical protein
MEHRWGQRFLLDLPASVADGNGWTAPARLRDISASGAFLECSPPVASVMRVLIRFKGCEVSSILTGDIVRVTSEGIGIEWGEFAPAAVAALLHGVPHDATRIPASEPTRVRATRQRKRRVEGEPPVPARDPTPTVHHHREGRAPR